MESELFQEVQDKINSQVNISAFYNKIFKDFNGFRNNVTCPFHDDKNASLQLNQNGSFKCHGCGQAGGGIIKFIQFYKEFGDYFEAMRYVWHTEMEEIVSEGLLAKLQAQLAESEDIQARLLDERGFEPSVLKAYGLGWTTDGERLVVPVYNRYGWVTQALVENVFRTPGHEKTVHMVSGGPAGRLWPVSVLDMSDSLVLVEGHRDALVGLSNDVSCCTIGSANYKLHPDDLRRMQGRDVFVCYDNDQQGRLNAQKIADQLMWADARVKVIHLPLQEGNKDLTDWFQVEKREAKELFALFKAEAYCKLATTEKLRFDRIQEQDDTASKRPFVDFLDLPRGEYYGKIVETEGEVVAKSPDVYLAPRLIKVTCNRRTKRCGEVACPMADAADGSYTFEMHQEDPDLAKFFATNEMAWRKTVAELMQVRSGCPIKVEIKATYPLTKVLIGPLMGYENSSGAEYRHSMAYCFGTEARLGGSYRFHGYVTVNPSGGEAMCVFLGAVPTASTLDRFVLSRQMHEEFEAFRTIRKFKDIHEDSFLPEMYEFYDHMGESITKIRQRPMVHMAVDLVYHSAVSFWFAGTFVRKAALDVLVLGDPRTGKGFIAEGLHRFYRHGEVLSGENISIMNLIGGVKIAGNFRGLCWGRIAANNRGTTLIDEMSALGYAEIGRLSRIRGDGIADLNKDGINAKTDAITGLIWLSNPRDGRMMSHYNYGVSAFLHLIKNTEDMARFDMVAAVAVGEVDPEVINTVLEPVPFRYDRQAAHDMILWAKSRTADQIEFTDDATAYILRQAIDLSKNYSEKIHLLLAENARIKLAKIAAAVAVRIYSTNETGNKLLVTKGCAMTAVGLLEDLYSSDVFGYRQFSVSDKQFGVVDEKALKGVFDTFEANHQISARAVASHLLRVDEISRFNIMDYFNCSQESAQLFLSELTKANAICNHRTRYVKTSAFTAYLRDVLLSSTGKEKKG